LKLACFRCVSEKDVAAAAEISLSLKK